MSDFPRHLGLAAPHATPVQPALNAMTNQSPTTHKAVLTNALFL